MCLCVIHIAFKPPSTQIKGQYGAPSKFDLEMYLMLSKTIFEGTILGNSAPARPIPGNILQNCCETARGLSSDSPDGCSDDITPWHLFDQVQN